MIERDPVEVIHWLEVGKASEARWLPQTPPQEALMDAVKWFREKAYAK